MGLVLLTFVVAACAARTDLGGQRGDAGAPLTGVVVNDCAPNDGHALLFEFAISGDVAQPMCSDVSLGPGRVRISFWSPVLTAPGTYTIGDGSFPSGSIAYFCPVDTQETECFTATHGTFQLTELTGTSASGSYSFVLPDASNITGSFENALVCDNSIQCG